MFKDFFLKFQRTINDYCYFCDCKQCAKLRHTLTTTQIMKQTIAIFALLISLCAKAQNNNFFQLPVIPDELQTLQERSDYMVEHYWDFCDLDKAFSSRDKMAEAFDTYLSFMPYASAETVYAEVGKFMKRISKKADNVLFIGELAEAKLYSDTAEMQSDELFLIFAKAVVGNKKVDKASKLRYQHLVNVLTFSTPGSIAPQFDYIDFNGNKGTFAADSTKVGTILFFNDPNCSDCNMARLRLDTDVITRRIIEGGKIDMVSVYASEPDAEWQLKAVDYPQSWKIVASEAVNDLYDMRHTPIFYVLNPNGAILLKTANVNDIINIMSRLQDRL